MRQRVSGFSLTELLVVIGIFALVLGLALPRMAQNQQQQQENNTVKVIAAQIRSAAAYAGSRRMTLTMNSNAISKTIRVQQLDGSLPDSGFEIRVPEGMTLPDGELLRFSPLGQVSASGWPISPTTVNIPGSGRDFTLEISSIGDVKSR